MPPLPPGRTYTRVSAGSFHTLAVRSDGQVVAFGENSLGQCDVPPLPAGHRYLDVAAGDLHSLALRTDGHIVAWGANQYGQCNAPPPPTGFEYVSMSCGEGHSLAMLAPRPSVLSYCTPGTSTSGCLASMGAFGSASVAANSGFTLAMYSTEGQKLGLFFYGVSGRAEQAWGAGSSFLCVKAPTQRMPIQSTGGSAGQCNGAFNSDWLAFIAANPGALGAPFSAGQMVNAQAWYRDPPSSKTTNLSNAVEFLLAP